jgi:hypothetical protein
MVLPQTQSTPKNETGPHDKIVSNLLPEVQQQNRPFIALAKISMDIKNINAKSVNISEPQKHHPRSTIRIIPSAQHAEKPLSYITTGSIMPTIPAATRNADILSLYQSLPSVHIQTVRQDGLQTDALPLPCDSHGLEHVLCSFRNIDLILRTVMNLQVFHTTISNWCIRFASMYQNIAIQLIPALNFNSDEWHADETVVKIQENATSGSFWTVRRALSLVPQGQSAGLYHTGCRKAYGGLLKPLSATVTSLKCLSRRCMG